MRLTFLLAALLATPIAALSAAQAAEGDPRKEAAERFDRGIRLFRQGDQAAALAEFKRAYQLSPEPLVLFNIGLVYGELRRPVEAVEALEKVLADPRGLKPESRARAEAALKEQGALIARLQIQTNVPAVIHIDDVEVARTPLAAPLKVASGSRSIAALASGYLPARRRIDIAGGEQQSLVLELIPGESTSAHVRVTTRPEGVTVVVDGKPVGATPLATSLAVAPGKHTIGLSRPGYHPTTRELTLGEGASGELDVELAEDGGALASLGGYLALAGDVEGIEVTVDGRARGAPTGPLLLPPGGHRVAVTRPGSKPFTGPVAIETGRTSTLQVQLAPSEEAVAAQIEQARSRRRWGWVALAAGTVIGAAGGGLLIYNAGEKDDASKALETAQASFVRGAGGECDTARGLEDTPACRTKLQSAQDRVSKSESMDTVAYVGLGVGAAAAITGAVLLFTSSLPETTRPTANAPAWRARPLAAVNARALALGLRIDF